MPVLYLAVVFVFLSVTKINVVIILDNKYTKCKSFKQVAHTYTSFDILNHSNEDRMQLCSYDYIPVSVGFPD